MNKYAANIAYYGCFVIALIIANRALSYAGDLAYTGKQPVVWVNLLAFFATILLVLLAIFIKIKYRV